MAMTPRELEAWIKDAIEEVLAELLEERIRVETFEVAGVLTTDRGLVVGFEDGSEIQLTLVRSRRERNDDE